MSPLRIASTAAVALSSVMLEPAAVTRHGSKLGIAAPPAKSESLMRNSRLSILFVTRIKALPLLDEFTLLCGPGPKKVVFAVFRHFSTEATEGNGGAN